MWLNFKQDFLISLYSKYTKMLIKLSAIIKALLPLVFLNESLDFSKLLEWSKSKQSQLHKHHQFFTATRFTKKIFFCWAHQNSLTLTSIVLVIIVEYLFEVSQYDLVLIVDCFMSIESTNKTAVIDWPHLEFIFILFFMEKFHFWVTMSGVFTLIFEHLVHWYTLKLFIELQNAIQITNRFNMAMVRKKQTKITKNTWDLSKYFVFVLHRAKMVDLKGKKIHFQR